MRRIAFLLGLAAAVALPGCGIGQRLGFGGAAPERELPYKAKLTRGDTERAFTVQVEANGAGLDQTRESVRFPATAHCLLKIGTGEIDWALDATGEWAGTVLENGDVVYAGVCASR